MRTVDIRLCGGFEVIIDGEPVPDRTWSRRYAAALVKLLALAEGRRLRREQVIDALWPELAVDLAAPRLHKAAHYARKALGSAGAVTLRDDTVWLLPDDDVSTDVARFEAAAATTDGTPESASAAADQLAGELLPGDRYEPWLDAPRAQLSARRVELLRAARRWDEVLAADPADEEAHLALMRRHARDSNRHGVLRQFERMERALRTELGVAPGPEAVELRHRALESEAAAARPAGGLIGRDVELSRFGAVLARVEAGTGGGLVVDGAAGVGKTALLDAFIDDAVRHGWRVGRGAAAGVEGAWPYAPVLEAVSDLCRRHPEILSTAGDLYRSEVERAIAGADEHWEGEGGHQKLFVAVGELLRHAGQDRPVLLAVDDLHDADGGSLRLLHYLVRHAQPERELILMGRRSASGPSGLDEMLDSLTRRGMVGAMSLAPLERAAAIRLAAANGATDDGVTEQIWVLSGGIPFHIVELAGRSGAVASETVTALLAPLDPTTRAVLEQVAVIGLRFDTDEVIALSGVDESAAFRHLEAAIAGHLLKRVEAGYEFRHPLIREAIIDSLGPHRIRSVHRGAATRLAGTGGSPARIAHHLIRARELAAAVPHVLRAARANASVGAYREAVALVDAVVDEGGKDRPQLLALRADLLFAVGDVAAVAAYRTALTEAPPGDVRLLRAKLSKASLMTGDLDGAAEAISGLELDGGPADTAILVARGNVAYFNGDIDGAGADADEARARIRGTPADVPLIDLIALQGLVAHNRGEWFHRLRTELQATVDQPEVAASLFDGHLCAAEYLLHGPTPYSQVIDLSKALYETARRAGSLRAMGFAATVSGEAALLSGDLDAAERDLNEALDIHAEIGAPAGQSVALQQLAEVHLARHDRPAARELLQRALPLARWSPLTEHLVPRVYGSMITAASDPEDARRVAEMVEATYGPQDDCASCRVMLDVPAAIAYADVGDAEGARRHLDRAATFDARFEGTSWAAAITEATAHLRRSEGSTVEANRLLVEAADGYDAAGRPLDAERCRRALAAV